MPQDAATAIAYVGAFVGLIGGGVALFNSWKAVAWKRAELANTYLKDFNNSPELVFAGRCLDWNGGKLVLPESLRPYMPDNAQFIQHDRKVFAEAMRPEITIQEIDKDPRTQIYRVSIDSFLSWMSLIASAIDRKLFHVEDLEDIGYWVAKLESEVVVHGFIRAYGYEANVLKLNKAYRKRNTVYKNWIFPVNTASIRVERCSSGSDNNSTDQLHH
jgi:hypothetical protein